MLKTHSVGLLSVVPRLFPILSSKMKNIDFIDVQKNTIETIKANNIKVLIADTDLLSEIMYDIPSVEWVQGTWAGFDKLLSKYNPEKRLQYVITRNTGPHVGAMMAEYVITNLVMWERNYYHISDMQKQQKWDRSGNVLDYRIIKDLRFSILGAGAIGKFVASVLKQLGASQIWGLVLNIPDVKPPCFDFIKGSKDIKEVLRNSDVIINFLPGTDLTIRFLNMSNLSVCEKALFINCGRGSIITEDDIIKAINKNYFSGAILDVFLNEPLNESSPLWKMKQVVITPHVAAEPRSCDIAEIFLKNWNLWVEKKQILFILDVDKQY